MGGEMCVWLRVERGRENSAAQQFSFQAHQNLIFSGKKNMRENGELGFWMKLPSNVQIFIKSFFFFFFVFFLFANSSFQNLSFLFSCAHPFFFFLILSFFSFFPFLFWCSSFLFSSVFFFFLRKRFWVLWTYCALFVYLLLNIIYLKWSAHSYTIF